jgi:hypothetical protein
LLIVRSSLLIWIRAAQDAYIAKIQSGHVDSIPGPTIHLTTIVLKKVEDILTLLLLKLLDGVLVQSAIIVGCVLVLVARFGKFLTAKPLSDRLSNRQPISRQPVGSTQPTRQLVDRNSALRSSRSGVRARATCSMDAAVLRDTKLN